MAVGLGVENVGALIYITDELRNSNLVIPIDARMKGKPSSGLSFRRSPLQREMLSVTVEAEYPGLAQGSARPHAAQRANQIPTGQSPYRYPARKESTRSRTHRKALESRGEIQSRGGIQFRGDWSQFRRTAAASPIREGSAGRRLEIVEPEYYGSMGPLRL
jgi:hypothetical protein